MGHRSRMGDGVLCGCDSGLAWASYRSSKQVEWFVGSLESHSTVRLRMEARRDALKVIAYDPNLQRIPGHVPKVGEEWRLEQIYLALPRKLRSV